MLINNIDHAKTYMTLPVHKTFREIISVINYTR